MKYFEDLTDKEILALTDKEIEHYCYLRTAQEGLTFVPKPSLPEPKKPNIQKTVTMFEACGVLFGCLANAEEFLELSPCTSTYDYAFGGYDYPWVEEHSEEITTKRFYSKENVENLKVELQEYNEKKSAYDAEQNTYNTFLRKLKELNKSIFDKVNELKKQEQHKKHLKKQYDNYLELANQDEEIAKNFFIKAYSEEEYNDLCNQ